MKFVIEHLSKNFEKKEVLRDIDFSLKKGRFTAFWGEMVQEKQRCLIVLIEM